MPRPKIYDETHFAFTQRRNPNGSIYVMAYRNEWDPVKQQSRIKERHNVGTLNPSTGRVIIGKKYLKSHPELEGKIIYYENNKLVEKTEEISDEFLQDKNGNAASGRYYHLGSYLRLSAYHSKPRN